MLNDIKVFDLLILLFICFTGNIIKSNQNRLSLSRVFHSKLLKCVSPFTFQLRYLLIF